MDNYLMIILLFLILITLYFYQENIYEYLNIKKFNNHSHKKKNKKKKKKIIQINDSESELSLDKSIEFNLFENNDENMQDENFNDNISMSNESKNRLLEELSLKDSLNGESNLSLNSGDNVNNDDLNDYNILD